MTWDAAYGVHYLLGIGILAPWNAFITAADYYEAQYPGRHADRLFSICYLPVQLVVLAVLMRYDSKWPARPRILLGLAGFCVIITAVPLLDRVTVGRLPLSATLLAVILTAVCDGLAQGAFYAEAAAYPPVYTQGIVAGTAASGAVLSVLRCITKGALPATPSGLRASADVYFLLAALVCVACLLCYALVLPRLLCRLSARSAAPAHAGRKGSEADEQHLMAGAGKPPTADLPLGQAILGYRTESELAEVQHQIEDSTPEELAAGSAGLGRTDMQLVVTGFRAVWRLSAALVVIYTVTLSIFPGVLAEDVKSQELGNWYPVALFTIFNFADLAGKSLPMWQALVFTHHQSIMWCAVARVLFIPAFWVAARHSLGPVVIVILALSLGLSNGYCTALAMMAGPNGLEGPDAAMAGQIMVFSLVLGLCIGAACGFLWLL